MAYQQADLDAIRACIASGALKFRYADGREVQYQSLEALMAAETRIASMVAAALPGAPPRQRTRAYRNGC